MKQKTFRPRNLVSKEVAGICGVARMADKARAAHDGNIGTYKYGADSQQDSRILSFLRISAEDFQEAAVQITNDIRLGVWVLDNSNRSDKEISAFNRHLKSWWKSKSPRNYFSKRRRTLAREDTDYALSILDWILILITPSWFD